MKIKLQSHPSNPTAKYWISALYGLQITFPFSLVWVFYHCLLEAVWQLTLAVILKQLKLRNYCLKASVWRRVIRYSDINALEPIVYQQHWTDQEVTCKIGMTFFFFTRRLTTRNKQHDILLLWPMYALVNNYL